ncbi:MAG TPA: cation diffusion facilitator family transporter [Solirubrobacteraceae bacterium]|nr:cation diffusion facilitator family transporter [Solirubrobacteraceae bacterium]
MSSTDGAPVVWTSGRSLAHSRGPAGASRKTVLIALVANAIVTVVKLAGGLLSGSAAMLAETAHSLADTVNQGFLLVSIALATREPTPDQPFGYGRMRFLWTFMAAVAMFLAGATFAIGYGIYQLASGPESGGYAAAYIALAISLVAEGSSWLRAIHQTRAEARRAQVPVLRYIRATRDPNVKMVVFEDTAALVGIAIAFVGILAGQLSGSTVLDPAASIAVGVLLVSVAGWMAHDTSELLVGASARPEERAAIEQTLAQCREIDRVLEVLTMVLGPTSLLVAARVDFAHGMDDDQVEQASKSIEQRLREAVPDVTEVFLDATTPPQRGSAPGRGSR